MIYLIAFLAGASIGGGIYMLLLYIAVKHPMRIYAAVAMILTGIALMHLLAGVIQ